MYYADISYWNDLNRASRNIKSKKIHDDAVSTSASSIYSKVRIKEMEVIMLSRKVILDVVLLVLTAGIMLAKAAYETDFPSKIGGWTE